MHVHCCSPAASRLYNQTSCRDAFRDATAQAMPDNFANHVSSKMCGARGGAIVEITCSWSPGSKDARLKHIRSTYPAGGCTLGPWCHWATGGSTESDYTLVQNESARGQGGSVLATSHLHWQSTRTTYSIRCVFVTEPRLFKVGI
jgi:hypothetical protein